MGDCASTMLSIVAGVPQGYAWAVVISSVDQWPSPRLWRSNCDIHANDTAIGLRLQSWTVPWTWPWDRSIVGPQWRLVHQPIQDKIGIVRQQENKVKDAIPQPVHQHEVARFGKGPYCSGQVSKASRSYTWPRTVFWRTHGRFEEEIL